TRHTKNRVRDRTRSNRCYKLIIKSRVTLLIQSPSFMTDTTEPNPSGVDTPSEPDVETVSALEAAEHSAPQFVRWFREVAPYVHAFRGKTFVVAFGGELIQANALNALVQDLSLLSALGIRLVLVHGSRPQV